jgi:hypothetical protein
MSERPYRIPIMVLSSISKGAGSIGTSSFDPAYLRISAKSKLIAILRAKKHPDRKIGINGADSIGQFYLDPKRAIQ